MAAASSKFKTILAECNWLNARRVRAYPKIFLVIYIIAVALYLLASPKMVDPLNKPVGTDFMNVWSAGKIVNLNCRPPMDLGRTSCYPKRHRNVYNWARHAEVQKAALPWQKGKEAPYYGWHYPPMFLMVAAVLALLPYGWALLAWMAATLPAYIYTIRAIIPRKEAETAALAFPAVFVNLGHGQNGFLTAGLLGGGVMLLEKRPYLAGVLFGLMAYKPQFGFLIPVALLLGWHWRAIFSAAMTVILTAAASHRFFGHDTWQAFFGSLKLTRAVVLEQGSTGWEKIQSIFSAVRMWGGSVELAYVAQALFAFMAAAAVAWAWKRKADMRLKGAVLATACLLATPYSLDYDLMLLALPVAWLAAAGLEDKFRPYEKTMLVAIFLLPLFSRSLGVLHIPVAPFVMLLLLSMLVQRIAKTTQHNYLRI